MQNVRTYSHKNFPKKTSLIFSQVESTSIANISYRAKLEKNLANTHVHTFSHEKESRVFKEAENMTVCSCHVTYAFQSESTVYSCLNVKELLARSRSEI